jgi:protocatechuate 3,4-dioxygenase beta subunit
LGAFGALAACADFADAIAPTTTTTTVPESTTTTEPPDALPEFPDGPAGDFAADGSNGPNVLIQDGVDRPDMTSSFGGLEGSVDGIPLKVQLTVANARSGTAESLAVAHLWHCTPSGQYSIYDLVDQNYLRAVQQADVEGRVQFTTVFPGCRPDRWPHIGLQVFANPAAAVAGERALKTTQLALPRSACAQAYQDPRYGDSASNFETLSIEDDEVFGDRWEDSTTTAVGDPVSGFVVAMLVPV